MNYFNAGWYVIYTRPKQERKVARCLEVKKLHHYLPLATKKSQWHDRKKIISTPLFPSYVFVMLSNHSEYYDAINGNRGLLYFVKSDGENARVDDKTIDSIRIILSNTAEVECASEYIQPGKDVIIRDGPFTGLNCQIVHHNNQQKVLVKINLLNRYVMATLPVESL